MFLVVAWAVFGAAPAQAQIPGLPPLIPPLFPQPKPPAVPPASPPPTPPINPPAPAVQPVFLGGDTGNVGHVTLGVLGPPAATAVYYERVGKTRVRLGERVLGPLNESRLLPNAVPWRCDRLVRRFEVDVNGPDGTPYRGSFSVRTPSCRNRFALSAPRRVARGKPVTVGVRDSWRTGDAKPRICLAPPGRRARCRKLTFRRGQTRARYRFNGTRIGTWRVRLRLAAARPLLTVEVGGRRAQARRGTPPKVLATGDSTIQGVDGFLADRLGDSARVVARQRTGTGISKPASPSWLKASRIQSSSLKPAATVVSIGANDGYPLNTPDGRRAACCGEDWVAEYSRRVRIMMRTWTRFDGHVVWMTLSTPGLDALRPQFSAVNTAIARAAVAQPRVTLARIDTLLSPMGVHEPTRLIRGKRVRMYLSDDVHLSPAGTAVAADAVAAALRSGGGLNAGR